MGGYFSQLLEVRTEALVQRQFEINGKTVDTYWRALTGAQRLQLIQGQEIEFRGAEGLQRVRLDLSAERARQLVQMTAVTADGKLCYRDLKELQNEPDWLIEALVGLAKEVDDSFSPEKKA